MPTAPPRSCGALRVLLDGLTGQFVEGVLAGGQLSGRSCLCVADPVSSVNRKPYSRAETRSHSDADEFRPMRSGRATSPLPAKGPAFPPGQGVLTPMWAQVSARERAWPFPPGQGVLTPMWAQVSARERAWPACRVHSDPHSIPERIVAQTLDQPSPQRIAHHIPRSGHDVLFAT